MNLAAAFVESARSHAAKTAVFWGDEQVSYNSLLAQAGTLAHRLTGGLAVRPGDRVALWMKNCPEYVPAFFGVLLAGGVVVPINNFLKPDEVAFILKDAGATTVIVDASMKEGVEKLAARAPQLRFLTIEEIAAGAAPAPALPSTLA